MTWDIDALIDFADTLDGAVIAYSLYEQIHEIYNSDMPDDYKSAAVILTLAYNIGGSPFPGGDVPLTMEEAYNLVYNTPDYVGGIPKEQLWNTLHNISPDDFPQDVGGWLTPQDTLPNIENKPTVEAPYSTPDERPPLDSMADIPAALDIAAGLTSPLVLDLNGNGIELAALNDTGSVYWNSDNGNFAKATGWIAGGDGLLAIDLNDDGVINNQSELFGNTATYANGFAALAAYDSNSDGHITSSDTDWDNLLVWVDSNADGYSQSSELHTLDELNITDINLNYSGANYSIGGNEIKQESSFTINGQTHDIVDAWFAYDTFNTKYVGDFTLSEDVFGLPSLRGYGNLPDLHIAMSQDATLLGMVQDIATADADTIFDSAFDIQERIEDIIYRWAGVDSVDPSSRGIYMDAQQLGFLEALSGKEWYSDVTNSSNPANAQAQPLKAAFESAYVNLFMQLIVQTDAHQILGDDAVYNLLQGTIENYAGVDHILFTKDSSTIYTSDINDFFIYNAGDNNDKIYDAGGTDTLLFGGGISIDDIRLWNPNAGGDLWIYVGSDHLIIKNQFDGDGQDIETALFLNGSSLDIVHNLTFTGTSAADGTIYGLSDDNILIGLGGVDTLRGYEGNDTYVFNLGDGNDQIYDTAGTDVLQFGSGITADDLRLWNPNAGGDLWIYVGNDHITINNQFYGTGLEVETASFEGGGALDLLHDLTFTGTSSGETMYGVSDDNILIGLAGNDTIYGYDGNDVLYGGSGIDNLYGGNDADTFMFEALTAFSGSDIIKDFSIAQNDVIDISDVLGGHYDPMTDTLTDFVQITTSGSNSLLKVDVDGTTNGVNFVQIAQVYGVTGLTDEQALVNSGNLVVA